MRKITANRVLFRNWESIVSELDIGTRSWLVNIRERIDTDVRLSRALVALERDGIEAIVLLLWARKHGGERPQLEAKERNWGRFIARALAVAARLDHLANDLRKLHL